MVNKSKLFLLISHNTEFVFLKYKLNIEDIVLHSKGLIFTHQDTLPQEVVLYFDKTSCRHSMISQYIVWAESSNTYSDITWCLQGVCGMCGTTPYSSMHQEDKYNSSNIIKSFFGSSRMIIFRDLALLHYKYISWCTYHKIHSVCLCVSGCMSCCF